MRECYTFIVVPITRQPHLWPNQDDLAIINIDTTVIADVVVSDWRSEIEQDILTTRMVDDLEIGLVYTSNRAIPSTSPHPQHLSLAVPE